MGVGSAVVVMGGGWEEAAGMVEVVQERYLEKVQLRFPAGFAGQPSKRRKLRPLSAGRHT